MDLPLHDIDLISNLNKLYDLDIRENDMISSLEVIQDILIWILENVEVAQGE
jgi:hypothetical protein